MAHEPKLTVFTLILKTLDNEVENTNRTLFKHLTKNANGKSIKDSVLFMDMFAVFLKKIDTDEMYKDEKSKKSMTAYQSDITDNSVDTKIKPNVSGFTISGVVDGGSYGRKRNMADISDKKEKTAVTKNKAITDEFYFLLYAPPASNKSVLLIQSFSDESIDSVVKDFFVNFLSYKDVFDKPKIKRHIPPAIIEDFKKDSVITQFGYSTTVTGKDLFSPALKINDKEFKVSIKIEPVEEMTMSEFQKSKSFLATIPFAVNNLLGNFKRKKATLKDNATMKKSSFEINSDYNIHPIIDLTKYIKFKNEEIDFGLVGAYCVKLLKDEIIPEIYPEYALTEH